jgi:hypothetical protein
LKNVFLNIFNLVFLLLLTTGCSQNIFDIERNGQSTVDEGFNPGLDPIPFGLNIITTTASHQTVSIKWSKAEFALSYDLYYRELGAVNFIKLENVTSPKNVTGLLNNRIYEFKVAAVNLRGSVDSDIVQATPKNGSSTTAEFASASAQMIRTPGNKHIVQGSLSTATDQVYGISQRGYKIFFNTQGQLLEGL